MTLISRPYGHRAVFDIARHVLMPLACGGTVYLCFRSTELGFFSWARSIGLSDGIAAVRTVASPLREQLPYWIVYSLPDGLWCYAATAAALLLWRDIVKQPALRELVGDIGLMAALAIELLQLTGGLEGTADSMDAALACLGWLVARRSIDCSREPRWESVRGKRR